MRSLFVESENNDVMMMNLVYADETDTLFNQFDIDRSKQK